MSRCITATPNGLCNYNAKYGKYCGHHKPVSYVVAETIIAGNEISIDNLGQIDIWIGDYGTSFSFDEFIELADWFASVLNAKWEQFDRVDQDKIDRYLSKIMWGDVVIGDSGIDWGI